MYRSVVTGFSLQTNNTLSGGLTSASGRSFKASRTIDLVWALCFLISCIISAGLTLLSNNISSSGVMSSLSSALVTGTYIHD
jgi:hypothetical protein